MTIHTYAKLDEARKLALLQQLTGAEGGADQLWNVFRAYVNTRAPEPAQASWLAAQDELLQGMIAEAGIASIEDAKASPLDARMALWRGDITTLEVDAVVNAANSQMLGCWVPGHFCIDNAIHTYAGVQLRRECYEMMLAQGHEEETGKAKITGAYNLPARHVIHTVGPMANGRPTDLHREQLASCYRSCLDLACEHGLHTLALCCISTGVFGFPAVEAAGIAVHTVHHWLDCHPQLQMRVLFDVFSAADERIYRELLKL